MTKRLIKISSVIATLLVIFWAYNIGLFSLLRQNDAAAVQEAIAGNLPSMLSFTLVIMVIQSAFSIIPLLLVVTINFALFGFVKGYIWSVVTSIIGAVIVFLAVRFLFQDMLMAKVNGSLRQKIESKGFFFVLLLRLFPFMPTSIINIVAGVSSVRFTHYLIATVIGNSFFLFILSLVPLGVLSIELEYIILIGSIILLVASIFGVRYLRNKKKIVENKFNA